MIGGKKAIQLILLLVLLFFNRVLNTESRADYTKVMRRTCHCIKKDECPLNGNCLTENTIYEAKITRNNNNDKPMYYIGLAETTFKMTIH